MKLKLTSLLILACALIMTGCTKTTSDYNSLLALLGGGGVASGMPAWTRLLGHTGNNTMGHAVAMDGDGNSYVTGETTGQLDPDRTGGIQNDVFIVKYDKDGVQQWVKQMGVETKHTYGWGVAADADGNSYVAGYTDANLVAGSGASIGSNDLFVAKYNTSGTRLWVKQLGIATKNTYVNGIAIDAQGNSYVTGYTNVDLDEDGTGVLTGTYDLYVVKYDTNGNRQWIQQRGAAGAENIGSSIAVDQDGNCYVTGKARGDIHTLGTGLTGSTDVFIAKYNTSGTLQWVIQKGVSAKETYGNGIAVDSSGNSYVTGTTWGALAGAGSLVGSADVYIMKYNTSGDLQWVKQTSAAGCWADGKGIALDSEGNCYATGITNADLDGTGPGVFTGEIDIFVIAYDKNGTSLWSRQMASDTDSDDIQAYSIAVTSNGTCIVAGYVDEAFDGQAFTGLWSDAFVTTKLNE